MSLLVRFSLYNPTLTFSQSLFVPRYDTLLIGQELNACSPIVVTDFGIVTDVKGVQLANAKSLIAVTPFGIIILVTLLPANAPDGIVVNEFEIVKL